MPLDVLVSGGRIATLSGDRGFGWVEAIGIRDGRIAFAGSAIDLETRADPHTRRIELDPDEVAIPGLTDAHLHLAEGGLAAGRLDLSMAATIEDALALIAAAASAASRSATAPDGRVRSAVDVGSRWLEGHGWLRDRFGRWPTADDLESVAPGRPVALWAHDHHALWVSRRALEIAGIDDATPDPPGGIVRRDAGGHPTGVLHEASARLVLAHVPPPSVEDAEAGALRLARALVALGVVAVHDPGALSLQAGLGPAIAGYRRLDEADDLPLRVHVSIRAEQLDAAIAAGLHSGDPLGPPGGRARFGWLKLFADGTLGSRTAALLEPIEGDRGGAGPAGSDRGIWLTEPAELADLAGRAAAAGIATQIHAIGDGGVRAALDALEPVAARTTLRPRVEHVQLLHRDDRPRLARSRIAASIQPIHLRSDAATARELWGDRAESRGYPTRSLIDAGALVAFGTDAPVEPIDPWPGLSMAVTRLDPSWPDDAVPFGPEERISLDQALRAACVAPAVIAGEDDRGRLVVGQRADLVVVPAEAMSYPVEPGGALGTARPRLVLIDGEVVFER